MVTNADYNELEVENYGLEKRNKLYCSMLVTAKAAIDNITMAIYAEQNPDKHFLSNVCYALNAVSETIQHITDYPTPIYRVGKEEKK